MASIMTNASALTALQSLNTTNKNLEMTQSRISTGFRVADATDNAAYWSIATTMRSDKRLALGRAGRARPRRRQGRHRLHRRSPRRSTPSTRSRTSWLPRVGASGVRQGEDPDRNQRAAGAAEDGRRRRHLLRLELAVGQHHHRHRRRRYRRRRQDRFGLHPHSAGTVALQTIDIKVDSREAVRQPSPARRQSRRASSTAARLGTSGARDVTATAAVARHGRGDRRLRASRR